jgi:hypothetical protein
MIEDVHWRVGGAFGTWKCSVSWTLLQVSIGVFVLSLPGVLMSYSSLEASWSNL